MCCCSVGIIIMKHALSLFPCTLCPSSPTTPLFFLPLCSSFYLLPPLLFPASFATCHVPVMTISHYPFLSNHVFFPPLSPLQRCQCHRCFVSPRSESYRFRSGNSTRRVSSWSPSIRLSIPVALVTHTSNASSTGQCWSVKHQGT